MSIFSEYYKKQNFIDRFICDQDKGIDVIIPVYHTNELWYANLISIYREVPVKRLLISDGGVIDNSIDVLKDFPRVEVFNHRQYKTLGKCIVELIKKVTSEWFIYLHSDVYLPSGWFDTMVKYNKQFDWYGCPMNITVLVDYRHEQPHRPYAGCQMGRKVAFIKGMERIDDDYVYRQEDFVFNKIVEDAGYKTGKIEDTFHYHQIMFRKSTGFDLNIKNVKFETITSQWEINRADETQIKGIVKYLPTIEPYIIGEFNGIAYKLLLNKSIDYKGFRQWIKATNPQWLVFFNSKLLLKVKYRLFLRFLKSYYKLIFSRL